jgi:3-(3-hydroxy-phenyl)propionate hydroxylase
MVMPGETEEELGKPENLRQLLAKVLPDPDSVELIRKRVYTHNARLAGQFRVKRVLLAGDAAHIMPVWQGQGYNSGMRDGGNLAWKLALVVKGLAGEALLDTYEQERRAHAKAMIDLSVLAGHVLAPPKRWQGALRDGISWLLNYLPPVKRYFLEMRFKPMPQYARGALVSEQSGKASPVGRLFIQPKVLTEAGETLLLDDVIGSNFAVIAWGNDPLWGLSREQVEAWRALGTRFIQVLPEVQLKAGREVPEGVIRVGDSTGRLKEWFGRYPASIALLRPDRFVAGVAIPQSLGQVGDQLLRALAAIPQAQQAPLASRVA